MKHRMSGLVGWVWVAVLLLFCLSPNMLHSLLTRPAEATIFAAVGTNDPNYCVQWDYRPQLQAQWGHDPNLPDLTLLSGPVLGPVENDPNVWGVPCGSWRRSGSWCDNEGYPVSIEVVEATLACESTVSEDGKWALTVEVVPVGWQVVRLRVTDLPPPQTSALSASRDVWVVFFGVRPPNSQPILR